MFTGYLLSNKSRRMLQILYPPKYSEFIGHHITEEFGVPEGSEAPEEPTLVEVVGYIDSGDGLEGFLVEIDGTSNRTAGGKYHITWSIDRDKGYKPVHTNEYVDKSEKISPIKIEVESRVFK